MRRVALIPARGGSKRLPRKNIADFLGRPIIAWTVEAALETRMFERVMVSTDDAEIAAISKKYGADVDERPPGLATDSARVFDVCADYLRRNPNFDILCCLYATAPLRTAADIRETVDLIRPGDCDFSLAVTHYNLPVHQALYLQKEGALKPVMPDLIDRRAADVPAMVVDNGSTYAASVPAFLTEKTFVGKNVRAHVMPRERSQDIDEPVDLELAKFYARRLQEAA